jgi:hypothetical protein
MKKKFLLSVLVAGMLVLGIEGVCLAGVEPSPFQPEINQLHSIELNVAAIKGRIANLNEPAVEGATNYLRAMAKQMQGLNARLEAVMGVLTPALANGDIGQAGQDKILFALDSIRLQSKGTYGIIEDIVSRMGIEPSPFLPLFNEVSISIITRVNNLIDPIQFPQFPRIDPPPIFQFP